MTQSYSIKTMLINIQLQNYPLSYAIMENDRWIGKGIAFEFVNYLSEKYEFNYSVLIPEEEILGNEQTGIIGMLHNNVSKLDYSTKLKLIDFCRMLM
jgi:hypothetical protein